MLTLTGPEIVARCSAIWGIRTVYYSQSSTATPTGHRADCSGYVSGVFGLPTPGLNTVTLLNNGIVYAIGWNELQPGDVLGILGNGTAGDAGHVAIYIGRSGDGYIVWEQSGGSWGPHQSTWGGNYTRANFLPYRYAGLSGGSAPTPTPGGNIMFCKKGDTGSVVSAMQILLLEAGGSLPQFGADGDYGAETAAAIVALGLTGGDTSGNTYGPTEYARLFQRVAQHNGGAGVPGPQGPAGKDGAPGPQGPKGDAAVLAPGAKLVVQE